MDHRYIRCPFCGLQNGEVCGDGQGGRECRCPECGPTHLEPEDFESVVIDDQWLLRELRRALDINSRDVITKLADDVWRLGHLKDTPVMLTRNAYDLLRASALFDRVRVPGKGIEVIAPDLQFMHGIPMGPADVQWLALEERFTLYGGGIRFIEPAEQAPSLPPADPTTPVHGPLSADFKWVTLLDHGCIRCTDAQAAVFKALWSFKGEFMPAHEIMSRAGLQSDKLVDIFKVKARDKDKPEAHGPLLAYRALVTTRKREGLYAMACAENLFD
jgi:hypothetical protein